MTRLTNSWLDFVLDPEAGTYFSKACASGCKPEEYTLQTEFQRQCRASNRET